MPDGLERTRTAEPLTAETGDDRSATYRQVALHSLWFNISVVFAFFLFLASYFTGLLSSSRNADVFFIGQFRNHPGMTEAQRGDFYNDYIELMKERFSLSTDVLFIAGSVLLFAVMVIGVTALVERKSFRTKFHPLPKDIQKKVTAGSGIEMSRFDIGKTLGATCVRLRRKQIMLSPDHLLQSLHDPNRAAEILRHEVIHARARDPAFNFLFNALLYIAIMPIFVTGFMGGAAAVVAFEEVREIDTGVIGTLVGLLWIGLLGIGSFKLRQTISRKFYDAKEGFADFDVERKRANASWVYFAVLVIIALGYASHPSPSLWVSVVTGLLLATTLLTVRLRIKTRYAAALAIVIVGTAAWLLTVLLNLVEYLIAKDPSSVELYLPDLAVLLTHIDKLPLVAAGFLLQWSLRR